LHNPPCFVNHNTTRGKQRERERKEKEKARWGNFEPRGKREIEEREKK